MHSADLTHMTLEGLFQKLKAAHVELRTCLDEVEALTTGPLASRPVYCSARFRISNASLKRRATFNFVCNKLSQSATAGEADTIARLRSDDLALIKRSAQHVRDWPAEQIDADWRGYCRASQFIRDLMARELRAVEETLFPILMRQSLRHQSHIPKLHSLNSPGWPTNGEARL
jgi:hypothetical protein